VNAIRAIIDILLQGPFFAMRMTGMRNFSIEPGSDSDLPDPNPLINYKRRRSVTVTRPSHFHALWMLPGGRGDCDYPTRDMLIKAGTLTISRRITAHPKS
jgi:hypothetical protein